MDADFLLSATLFSIEWGRRSASAVETEQGGRRGWWRCTARLNIVGATVEDWVAERERAWSQCTTVGSEDTGCDTRWVRVMW